MICNETFVSLMAFFIRPRGLLDQPQHAAVKSLFFKSCSPGPGSEGKTRIKWPLFESKDG